MDEVRNYVLTNAAQIFRRAEQKLFIVDTSVKPSGECPFEIDVLALDKRGRSVIGMINETMEDASGREMLVCRFSRNGRASAPR